MNTFAVTYSTVYRSNYELIHSNQQCQFKRIFISIYLPYIFLLTLDALYPEDQQQIIGGTLHEYYYHCTGPCINAYVNHFDIKQRMNTMKVNKVKSK